MTRRLVESVPNISEGRDQTIIDTLAKEIQAIPNVDLLDVHVDPDHHRSVFTLVGEPKSMSLALFGLVRNAQQRININHHQGEHPRIGVVDVVPWIPLQDVSMEDCAFHAKALGSRIGRELEIPVFLYDQAGAASKRTKLEEIRRGGLSALKAKMEIEQEWQPDYGPPIIHPTAGAIVVGARFFLVAFNVVLQSDDLQMAHFIAQSIRTSNGGLPSLKALGIPLTSRKLVQVSMNLTDYRETSLRQAFEAVNQEARKHNVEILESEIVGLIPKAAWDESLLNDLKLRPLKSDPVIEERLAQSSFV